MATSVQQLVQIWYGRGTASDQNESDITLNATTPVLIARNSPARFSVLISNNTSSVISISYNPGMTFASGMQVPPGGTYASNWLEDLDTPARALWAMQQTAGGTCHVVESFLVQELPTVAT
jgi:hypothetical protein